MASDYDYIDFYDAEFASLEFEPDDFDAMTDDESEERSWTGDEDDDEDDDEDAQSEGWEGGDEGGWEICVGRAGTGEEGVGPKARARSRSPGYDVTNFPCADCMVTAERADRFPELLEWEWQEQVRVGW
jgi:hypothetical protein